MLYYFTSGAKTEASPKQDINLKRWDWVFQRSVISRSFYLCSVGPPIQILPFLALSELLYLLSCNP
uniref:Uncharacterized protein n=1 Tax=Utricularia reniformis TaxID=192314 RepID=A0A1Y0B404_9LAMI|nr:hypothetical protein AEK19_MT2027 [Utricularia reniformis]ART32186.1 hypothetical protein AEK19_MT2027 [Utricularia reniformis]